MIKQSSRNLTFLVQFFFCMLLSYYSTLAYADTPLQGYVLGANQPIADATVTLWSTDGAKPQNLGQTKTNDKGFFKLNVSLQKNEDAVFYVTAMGGRALQHKDAAPNSQIGLISILGTTLPTQIVVNELTTIASIWTNAQFLNNDTLTGDPLGLKIAANNVPNWVDLETGMLGSVIQDNLNSTTTMLAQFSTLANILSSCVTAPQPSGCNKLFSLTQNNNEAVTNTLIAMQTIARAPTKDTALIFQLFDESYPVVKDYRNAPYLPYLIIPPSSWTLALHFSGGGLSAAGKIMIDEEGNLWTTNNFLLGSQSSLTAKYIAGLGISKIASNGKALSPATFGFTGGGMDGGAFGLAIDPQGAIWAGNYHGKNLAKFNGKTGKALSPETGYTFNGKLGKMQGVIATKEGDIWALDNTNNQIVRLPKGDVNQAQFYCHAKTDPQSASKLYSPFHLAIDQKNQIWVTNGGAGTVTRFPADHPEQAASFNVEFSPKGIAIDSQGNAWVSNFIGKATPGLVPETVDQMSPALWDRFKEQITGSVTLLKVEGESAKPITFTGRGIKAPWGIAIDGNDNVWVVSFNGHAIVQLCGANTQNCPAGYKTGDPISPATTGFIGGGMQQLTDVAIDPAGDVWVANNWNNADVCFDAHPAEDVSTHCPGVGLVVFYGLAKPVKVPLIGPVRTTQDQQKI